VRHGGEELVLEPVRLLLAHEGLRALFLDAAPLGDFEAELAVRPRELRRPGGDELLELAIGLRCATSRCSSAFASDSSRVCRRIPRSSVIFWIAFSTDRTRPVGVIALFSR
jgi:hypothetical protein